MVSESDVLFAGERTEHPIPPQAPSLTAADALLTRPVHPRAPDVSLLRERIRSAVSASRDGSMQGDVTRMADSHDSSARDDGLARLAAQSDRLEAKFDQLLSR